MKYKITIVEVIPSTTERTYQDTKELYSQTKEENDANTTNLIERVIRAVNSIGD